MESEKNYRQGKNPQEVFIELYSPDLKFKKKIFSQRFCKYKYVEGRAFLQPFYQKIAWDVGHTRKIIMGISDKSRIDVYDPISESKNIVVHKHDAIEVTADMKEQFYKSLNWGGKRLKVIPASIKKHYHFPKYKPAFGNIAVDTEGNILIFPQIKTNFFYAYDEKIGFLNKVEIKSRVINSRRILFTKDHFIWFFDYDSNFEHYIVKCKILE